MENRKLVLQYQRYFFKPERITIGSDISEDEALEMQLKQERVIEEYQEKINEAEVIAEQLIGVTDDVISLFQKALHKLYGVHFDEEDILFIEEPNFSYEGDNLIEKAEQISAIVKDFLYEKTKNY